MARILRVHDLHIHARAYHGLERKRRPDMTVEAIVKRTEELGLTAVGLLDHVHADGDIELIRRISAAARRTSGGRPRSIRLLVGAELDILDENGTTPRGVEQLGLDYYLVAAHGAVSDGLSLQEKMERYQVMLMAAAKRCEVMDGVAHPWREAHDWSDDWRFSLVPKPWRDELIHALAKRGKCIEVNRNHQPDFEDAAFREFVANARDAGVKVVIGSDAHEMSSVGEVQAVADFLSKLGFRDEHLWLPSGN